MARASLDKLAGAGAVIVAAACPVCFPKLALIGAVLGLGVFAPLEGYLVFVVQALAVLALAGHVLSFHAHHNRWLLGLAVLGTLALFAGFYVAPSAAAMQLGLLALAAASVWLFIERRRASCETRPTEAVERASR